jgi:hypothetical protein
VVRPHSAEAERLLLGCCLLDEGESLRACLRRGFEAGHFYVPAHGLVWRRLVELVGEREVVDLAVLGEVLRDRGELASVGGVSWLAGLLDGVPSTAQVGFFMDQVEGLHRRRLRVAAAQDVLDGALSGDEGAADEAVARLAEVGRGSKSELPPILGFGDFVGAEAREKPAELVEGLLHRGAKLMLSGGSKSFKTWVLMDLALSVAAGVPWWGFRVARGRVLYLNMELMVEFAEDRMRAIMEAKGIAAEGADGLDTWHLRGYARDFKELLPLILRAVEGVQYDLIILDPVYKVLGERDENANGEVAQLLNEFEALAVRTGAAIAYGHHHSKGAQGDKDARDRSSGAGAWTRDPDSLVDLTPHQEEEHFIVTYTLRNHRPRAKHVVEWDFPCMRVAPGLDPDEARKPGKPREHGVADILRVLGDELMGFAEWQRAAEAKGVSASTFKRLLREAKDAGRVRKVGLCYQAEGGAK